jgi:hypothetical protein
MTQAEATMAGATDRSTAADPEVGAILARLPAAQRADAETLIDIMSETTGEPAHAWRGKVIGFGQVHYRYPSGREGDAGRLGFAPTPRGFTLYLMSGMAGYDDILAGLGRHTTGKSCLYLRRLSEVDLDALRRLLERSARHLEQTEGALGSLPRMDDMPAFREPG